MIILEIIYFLVVSSGPNLLNIYFLQVLERSTSVITS